MQHCSKTVKFVSTLFSCRCHSCPKSLGAFVTATKMSESNISCSRVLDKSDLHICRKIPDIDSDIEMHISLMNINIHMEIQECTDGNVVIGPLVTFAHCDSAK